MRPCGLSKTQRIALGGLEAVPDLSGALFIPALSTLIVADLHLEKASSLARRGAHLPPYDTRATLTQLGQVLAGCKPERLIFLGDSFHDGAAGERIAPADVAALAALTAGREVIWIAGNHDPAPPLLTGGQVAQSLAIGAVVLRHEPTALVAEQYEIAGHLHPAAAITQRGRRLRCKCFIANAHRLLLPAFGSFTGGLDVMSAPIAALYPARDYAVWMLGAAEIYRFTAARLG